MRWKWYDVWVLVAGAAAVMVAGLSLDAANQWRGRSDAARASERAALNEVIAAQVEIHRLMKVEAELSAKVDAMRRAGLDDERIPPQAVPE